VKKLKEQPKNPQKKEELIKSALFFEKADFKKLKLNAVKKNESVSAILRQLIKEYLAESK